MAQNRSEAAAPDRRSVLAGLGSLLTAVQASPSIAAKETAQVGDYLPAMPGLDGFVEFIPDRKKVGHPTVSVAQTLCLSHISQSCSISARTLSAVACHADSGYPCGNGKPAHFSLVDPSGAHVSLMSADRNDDNSWPSLLKPGGAPAGRSSQPVQVCNAGDLPGATGCKHPVWELLSATVSSRTRCHRLTPPDFA